MVPPLCCSLGAPLSVCRNSPASVRSLRRPLSTSMHSLGHRKHHRQAHIKYGCVDTSCISQHAVTRIDIAHGLGAGWLKLCLPAHAQAACITCCLQRDQQHRTLAGPVRAVLRESGLQMTFMLCAGNKLSSFLMVQCSIPNATCISACAVFHRHPTVCSESCTRAFLCSAACSGSATSAATASAGAAAEGAAAAG